MTRLRFVQHGVNGVDRAGGHPDICQFAEPPVCCLACKGGSDMWQQPVTILYARAVCGIGRIIGKGAAVSNLAEFPEL